MRSQDTIQIRIDSKTKKAAKKTLDGVGLDMSSAVKLFLTNVINRKGIPLDLRTENGFTLAQEQALIAETEEAKKNAKRFATVDSLMADLLKQSMKYEIVKTRRFKTAFKRVKQLNGFKQEVFEEVVSTLAEGKKLKKERKDHQLTGNLKAFRECHIAPDILLVYQIDNAILILTLVSVGNHSQLFK